jgi:predicted nucleic acid-binding protein
VRYLVDADWLIDALLGHRPAVTTLDRLSGDGLAVSIVAVAELYEGAFGSPDPFAALDSFRVFLSDYAILPLTDPIATQFARLRAMLRQQGQLIPDMDLFIAATALEHDLTLITRNVRHFDRIPELTLSQPS